MNLECPHCGTHIQIIEANCGIFRCGIYKSSGKQLNPHASKEVCDQVFKEGLIYGCGKPFQLVEGQIIKCDYK